MQQPASSICSQKPPPSKNLTRVQVHSRGAPPGQSPAGVRTVPAAPAGRIRGATRQAFLNLVDLALEEDVPLVLIAGDVYDGDWKGCNTGLFFTSQLSRLGREGLGVFVTSGSHDAASRLARCLQLPENHHMFSARKPRSEIIQELSVAVHGHGVSSQFFQAVLDPGLRRDDGKIGYSDRLPGHREPGGFLPRQALEIQDLCRESLAGRAAGA